MNFLKTENVEDNWKEHLREYQQGLTNNWLWMVTDTLYFPGIQLLIELVGKGMDKQVCKSS